MPIYEYQCTKCKHQLETIQKMSDPPLADCPACGDSTLRKMVSAASFRLKGSGWYETDFKHKPGAKGNGKSGSETSQTSDTSASGSIPETSTSKDSTSKVAAGTTGATASTAD
jgi:putative FmdB family regulatory protein